MACSKFCEGKKDCGCGCTGESSVQKHSQPAAPALRRCEGVEIFATGRHRDKDYGPSDLDQINANFKRLSMGEHALLTPPIVIGHEEPGSQPLTDNREAEAEQQGVPLDNTGVPALGVVEQCWLVKQPCRACGADGHSGTDEQGEARKCSACDGSGKMTILMANFADVQPDIAQLIDQRSYRKVSSEIYDDFKHEGQSYGMVLRRVALLGGEIPQVKTLRDIPVTKFSHTSLSTSWVTMDCPNGVCASYEGPDGKWYWRKPPVEQFAETPGVVREFCQETKKPGPCKGWKKGTAKPAAKPVAKKTTNPSGGLHAVAKQLNSLAGNPGVWDALQHIDATLSKQDQNYVPAVVKAGAIKTSPAAMKRVASHLLGQVQAAHKAIKGNPSDAAGKAKLEGLERAMMKLDPSHIPYTASLHKDHVPPAVVPAADELPQTKTVGQRHDAATKKMAKADQKDYLRNQIITTNEVLNRDPGNTRARASMEGLDKALMKLDPKYIPYTHHLQKHADDKPDTRSSVLAMRAEMAKRALQRHIEKARDIRKTIGSLENQYKSMQTVRKHLESSITANGSEGSQWHVNEHKRLTGELLKVQDGLHKARTAHTEIRKSILNANRWAVMHNQNVTKHAEIGKFCQATKKPGPCKGWKSGGPKGVPLAAPKVSAAAATSQKKQAARAVVKAAPKAAAVPKPKLPAAGTPPKAAKPVAVPKPKAAPKPPVAKAPAAKPPAAKAPAAKAAPAAAQKTAVPAKPSNRPLGVRQQMKADRDAKWNRMGQEAKDQNAQWDQAKTGAVANAKDKAVKSQIAMRTHEQAAAKISKVANRHEKAVGLLSQKIKASHSAVADTFDSKGKPTAGTQAAMDNHAKLQMQHKAANDKLTAVRRQEFQANSKVAAARKAIAKHEGTITSGGHQAAAQQMDMKRKAASAKIGPQDTPKLDTPAAAKASPTPPAAQSAPAAAAPTQAAAPAKKRTLKDAAREGAAKKAAAAQPEAKPQPTPEAASALNKLTGAKESYKRHSGFVAQHQNELNTHRDIAGKANEERAKFKSRMDAHQAAGDKTAYAKAKEGYDASHATYQHHARAMQTAQENLTKRQGYADLAHKSIQEHQQAVNKLYKTPPGRFSETTRMRQYAEVYRFCGAGKPGRCGKGQTPMHQQLSGAMRSGASAAKAGAGAALRGIGNLAKGANNLLTKGLGKVSDVVTEKAPYYIADKVAPAVAKGALKAGAGAAKLAGKAGLGAAKLAGKVAVNSAYVVKDAIGAVGKGIAASTKPYDVVSFPSNAPKANKPAGGMFARAISAANAPVDVVRFPGGNNKQQQGGAKPAMPAATGGDIHAQIKAIKNALNQKGADHKTLQPKLKALKSQLEQGARGYAEPTMMRRFAERCVGR